MGEGEQLHLKYQEILKDGDLGKIEGIATKSIMEL